MDKAVHNSIDQAVHQTVSYCTDCKVIPVSSQGSMCTGCIEVFYIWLKWEDYYTAQELEDRLETLAREYAYQETYHRLHF